jgi:hypothetical protein
MSAPAWEAGLRSSAVFCCLVTPHYLRSPECWAQIDLARQLQKPFRVIVQHGTTIPEGFFTGVEDLKVYTFRTNGDLRRIARQLADELGRITWVDAAWRRQPEAPGPLLTLDLDPDVQREDEG